MAVGTTAFVVTARTIPDTGKRLSWCLPNRIKKQVKDGRRPFLAYARTHSSSHLVEALFSCCREPEIEWMMALTLFLYKHLFLSLKQAVP